MIRPVRALRMAGKTAFGDACDSEEVEVHRPRQLINAELFQRSAMSGTGVVHQQVDASQVSEDGTDA
jgi:hypothetical protein